jgi:hypothetical protein
VVVCDVRVRGTGRAPRASVGSREYLEVSRAGGKWEPETVGRSLLDPDLDANATSGNRVTTTGLASRGLS